MTRMSQAIWREPEVGVRSALWLKFPIQMSAPKFDNIVLSALVLSSAACCVDAIVNLFSFAK